jgi:hypothetical protein
MMAGLLIPTGDPPKHPKGLDGSCIIDGVLIGEDVQCANWVHQVLSGGIIEVGFVGFGIVPIGTPNGKGPASIELVGGMYYWGYENDTQQDIFASVAVTGALLDNLEPYRPAIRQILDYPFGILKLSRISVEMAMSNEVGIQAAQKLGFTLEGRKRKKMKDGGDVGLFGLLATDAQRAGSWQPYT